MNNQFPQQDPRNREDENFMADTKSAFLSKSTFMSHAILYALIVLLVIGLVWAYFGKVEQVTIGEGKVIPSSQVKIIQSLDGGIISQLPVKEGQEVKKGQIVARLDDTRYRSDFRERYAKYLALLASNARLQAELQNKSTVDFPAELIQENPTLVRQERELFETETHSIKEEIALLENSLALANRELEMYKPLVEKGIVAQVEYLRAQRNTNDIRNKILEKKNHFRESTGDELSKVNSDLAVVTEELTSLRDKLDRATLYSPVNGIIKKLNVVTIGGVVTPGLNIMEIVPIEDSLLVQAHVKPKDIAFVEVGQPASVKIAAYDYSIYGSLDGTVEYISPDAIEEPKAAGQDAHIYYLVNVRTKKGYVGNNKNKLPIIPGMTATINIMTGEKRVLDYLLKPLFKAKEEALRER